MEELIEWAESQEMRGEFVLVVEGSTLAAEEEADNLWWESLSVVAHVNHYIEEKGFSSKDAIKQVAVDRNIPKRDVYQMYHIG